MPLSSYVLDTKIPGTYMWLKKFESRIPCNLILPTYGQVNIITTIYGSNLNDSFPFYYIKIIRKVKWQMNLKMYLGHLWLIGQKMGQS